MDKITIQIDSKWVKVIHSKRYFVVGSLTGVSVTFAPIFLFVSGMHGFLHGFGWVLGLFCFAIIHYVGSFYIKLGGEVVRELLRAK